MNAIALALALSITPVHTAETIPQGKLVLHLDAGFILLGAGIPALRVAPLLSGDVELGYGLVDGLDFRVRYTTHLGWIHRLGPELRWRAVDADPVAIGARVQPSVQFVGAAQGELDYGGDVSSYTGLLATYRAGFGAITAEAGITVQWLLYEDIDGRRHTDGDPYLAYWEAALEVEWPTSAESNLSVRLEASVPRSRDDPFTVLGVIPRIVVGGSFAP